MCVILGAARVTRPNSGEPDGMPDTGLKILILAPALAIAALAAGIVFAFGKNRGWSLRKQQRNALIFGLCVLLIGCAIGLMAVSAGG